MYCLRKCLACDLAYTHSKDQFSGLECILFAYHRSCLALYFFMFHYCRVSEETLIDSLTHFSISVGSSLGK